MAYDEYTSIISDDPRTGAPTFEQLQARRKIAIALATRNRGFPNTIGQGLTYLGEALGDNLADQRSSAAEAAYKRQTDAEVRRLSGADAGATAAPAAPAPVVAAPDTGPTSVYDPVGGGVVDNTAVTNQLSAKAQAPQQSSLLWKQIPEKPDMTVDEFNQRTARNESGGEKDPYRAIGKEISRRGDRAYGKYQVMGENIPVWTRQYFGQELTPQQFLDSKDAQEAVAKGRGGEYLAKYGPNGAAAAWFAGENGMKDASRPNLQTHIADYVQKFNRPPPGEERNQIAASAAGGGRPIQLASLGGMPTPDTAPDPARDAMAQSLAGPPPAQPQQAPAPLPVQVAQAQQQIGRPPPTPPPEVVPRYTAPTAPKGPPPMPTQEPQTKQEMDIRRAIGASTDPNFKGRLEPIADRLEAERKFKDTQNMAAWQKDYSAWEKQSDPTNQAQLRKLQEEEAQRARELRREQARGGVPQAVLNKGIEDSEKRVAPLREASVAINQIEDLLNKGMFTGTLGKVDLAVAKLKSAGGFATDPRIANTENFTSAIKPITAAARQALAGGANISDRDLQAAEAAAGGNITLNKESIQQIMKSLRVIQMQTAMHHHQLLATAAGGDPAAEKTLYGVYGLPMENILSKTHPAVERLMQNADNEHERELFNSAFKTPGLAEKVIIRNRAPR